MAEAGVEEISGVAYQYNPRFFEDLYEQYGVRLENIVYYKDETHYFVMTALKSSLLAQGVFKQVSQFFAPFHSVPKVGQIGGQRNVARLRSDNDVGGAS